VIVRLCLFDTLELFELDHLKELSIYWSSPSIFNQERGLTLGQSLYLTAWTTTFASLSAQLTLGKSLALK